MWLGVYSRRWHSCIIAMGRGTRREERGRMLITAESEGSYEARAIGENGKWSQSDCNGADERWDGQGLESGQRMVGPSCWKAVGIALILLAAFLPGARGTCNATCKCVNPDMYNQDPVVYGQTCIDQGPCGNLPCTGGAGCPSSAPAAITAIVTGEGKLGIYWEDPSDYTMVDQYNIYFSMTEASSACNSLATGAVCSFTLPEESFSRTGVCGTYNGGAQMFCYIDLAIQIASVPPCVQQAPAVQGGCNWENLASGVVVGRHFYFRINAGRCCYGAYLFTPGCTACTDPEQTLTCPLSPTYAYSDVVSLAVPTAVRNITIRVSGDRAIAMDWAVPADTGGSCENFAALYLRGSRTSNVQDLKLVRVTRSTVSDFSSGNVIFNLANTALSFSDSALVPGTVYHYRIETGNSACSSSADVCGQSDSIIISAVGVPSAPTSLASALVAGSPGAYDLSWAAPSDTGQGNGSPSVVEVLTGYDVLQDGTLKASQAGTTYRLTGLVLGQSYVISVRAKNQAGQGLLLTSLTRKGVGYPSKPLFFTATVSAVDGPLKIRLNWATPSDTGQGNGNSDTQLTGYKVLLASANEVKVGSAWTSDFATSTTPLEVACANTAACSTTTVLTFGAARAKPYVMRVYAQNPVGYGALAEIWEQAVALPSAPLSLSALVTSPNQIKLSWMLPVDTGVGDQSRPLVSVYVQRSFGSANLDACTVNCTSCTGSCITSQIGACCSDTLASTTTSITLTNVPAAETRYYVRVKGGNDVGVGAASGVANEQGVSLPSAPTALTTSFPAKLAMDFLWAKPADTGVGTCSADCRPIMTYVILVVSSSGDIILSETVPSNITSRFLTGLSHSVTYTITITASNTAGIGTAAAQLTGERPRDVPTRPTSFTAIVGTTAFQIKLLWGTPTDTGAIGTTEPIIEYVVEIDTVSSTFDPANTKVICGTGASCTAPLTSCTCNTLTATIFLSDRRATPYYMRVKAVNKYGSSLYGIADQFSVGITSAPRSVAAIVIGIRTINVSWTFPTDNGLGDGIARALDSYILQRSFNSSTFAGCAAGLPTNDNCADGITSGACCSTSGLTTSTYLYVSVVPTAGVSLFYYRVYAKNEVGVGVASTAASEQGVDVPSAPQNLNVDTIGPAQFSITWTSPLNTGVGGTTRPLFGYRLEVIKDPNVNFATLYFAVDLDPTVTTYTKRDFTGGTNYTFRVLAKNVAGLGAPSNTIKVPAIALPSPPQSFTAIVTTPLQIALGWLLPADTGFGDQTTASIREYRVNVSTTGDWTTGGTVLATGDTTFLSYLHTGLTEGAGYHYRVQARTDAGWSDPSSAFEEGVTVPTEPYGLALNITTQLKIGAVWQLPAHTGTVNRARPLTALRLEIIASASQLASWTTATSVIPLTTSTQWYLLESLTKGHFYYFRLIATNSAGEGSFSLVTSERGLTVPDRPGGLTVTIIGPLAFTVTFVAPSDTGLGAGVTPSRLLSSNAYKLQSSTDSAFTAPTDFILSNGTFLYSFSGLTKNQRYYYRVFASNVAGTSVSSLQANQVAIDLPFVPQNPTVTISTANQRELILTWEAPMDTGSGGTSTTLTQYRVQEQSNTPPGSSSINITFTNPAPTIQTVVRSSLAKGINFYYQVFASNAAGEGSASVVVNEMAIDKPSVPLSPSLVIVGSLRLLLTWSPPNDTGNGVGASPARQLTQYEIKVDGTSSAMTSIYLPTDKVLGTTTNYTRDPTSLEKGRVYYMQVIAYNQAGASPATTIVFATAIAAPTSPQGLQALVSSPLQIALSWTMPANTGGVGQSHPLVKYRLMRASVPTFVGEVAIQQDLNTSRLETNLAKGGNFYYRVFATNEAGTSDASNTAFEQGVDIPSAPAGFTISHPAVLSLQVVWQLPLDTGLGDQNRAILRYVMETENILSGGNGTFLQSPFTAPAGCFLTASPPCNPAQVSPHQIQLVPNDLITRVTQNALIKGNTHYFRVRAVNSAGGGPFTSIIFEQALVLPTGPTNIDVTLVQYNGQAAYALTWKVPIETGAGQTVIGGAVINSNLPGQARQGIIYEAQAAVNSAWTQPDASLGTTLNLTTFKVSPQEGAIYSFRVSAINEIGRGPWTAGATSGPQIDTVAPSEGGAMGGLWVTVTGKRFGSSEVNIQAWIGDTRCGPIVMITSDQSFRCLAAPGTGGSKHLFLSVIGLETSFSTAFAYLGPIVRGVSPGQVEADGGEAVTITGKNFGAKDMTPKALLVARGAESCTTTLWASDSSVVCWVSPASSTSEEKSGISIIVDRQESGPDGKVQLVRVGLETYLRECPSQATSDCFDCAVRACYAQRIAATQASGVVVSGDALDECELAAAAHCGLDRSID